MKVIMPGSYDPVTTGHLDMIKRVSELYDEVYAVVFINPDKTYMFGNEERKEMLALACSDLKNVKVDFDAGLCIDYMKRNGIEKIVKGYRSFADLAYERGLAEWNLQNGGYPTEFIECRPPFKAVSATLAREKIKKGENLEGILPPCVIAFLKNH